MESELGLRFLRLNSVKCGCMCAFMQGNPAINGLGLGESISFGRFMSETLCWEKWSTFSHKRYVEEAEKYARPGSVAEKKAFFEAHFKRIAAKKAAALLEQAEAANSHPEPEIKEANSANSYSEPEIQHANATNIQPEPDIQKANAAHSHPKQVIQQANAANSYPELDIQQQNAANSHPKVEIEQANPGNSHSKPDIQKTNAANNHPKPKIEKADVANSHQANDTNNHPEREIEQANPASSHPKPDIQQANPASSHPKPDIQQANHANSHPKPDIQLANATNNHPEPEIEQKNAANSHPEPYIQKEITANSHTKSEIEGHNSNAEELEGLEIGKEKSADSVTENEILVEKKQLLNQHQNAVNQDVISETELGESAKMEKQGFESLQETSLPIISKKKLQFPSPKLAVQQRASRVSGSIHSRRENNATPLIGKTLLESSWWVEREDSTRRSLLELFCSTPTKELDKSTTPAVRRIGSSRVAPSPQIASKDYRTLASGNGVLKHPSATPSRRCRTPVDSSTPGSKTAGPKWRILSSLSEEYELTISVNVLSVLLSHPRLNDKHALEKGETEIRKLRQSLCFKARPLPDFYKDIETSKDQIKNVKVSLSAMYFCCGPLLAEIHLLSALPMFIDSIQ
ncbi:hypothetical protein U1Q18_012522 [Sarracenia purpurea var. burkii]